MDKFKLKLSKFKFELKKIVLGCLYIALFLTPFDILKGNFNLKTFIPILILPVLLTVQHIGLYDLNTKWNESIKL